jgi:electron transfer flavoprotein beta subunit
MKVAVIIRQVPDVVEELVIAEDGRSLSEDDVMYITNELDDHALEQALILKGRHGAHVAAYGIGGSEARDALATSVAKGADEAVYVPLEFKDRGDNHKLAMHLASLLRDGGFDLILSGMQAADQVDGSLGGLLASHLSMPYVGGLVGVDMPPGGGKATVKKEYPGGRIGVMDVTSPAVLGIQSSEQPPRYVPVSKVMQAKKTLQVKELKTPVPGVAGVHITQLQKPEAGARAKMLEGDEAKVAAGIAGLLKERGLL